MCNYRLQLQYGNETIMTHDSHARHNLERLLSRPACHGAAWSGDEYSVCNPPHPLFDEDACKARYPGGLCAHLLEPHLVGTTFPSAMLVPRLFLASPQPATGAPAVNI